MSRYRIVCIQSEICRFFVDQLLLWASHWLRTIIMFTFIERTITSSFILILQCKVWLREKALIWSLMDFRPLHCQHHQLTPSLTSFLGLCSIGTPHPKHAFMHVQCFCYLEQDFVLARSPLERKYIYIINDFLFPPPPLPQIIIIIGPNRSKDMIFYFTS